MPVIKLKAEHDVSKFNCMQFYSMSVLNYARFHAQFRLLLYRPFHQFKWRLQIKHNKFWNCRAIYYECGYEFHIHNVIKN